jgi:hypothetical protein
MFDMRKSHGIGIMSLFLLSSVLVQAQNGNTSLVVSKGVQQVSNKKAFEEEKKAKPSIEAKSVEFPVIVMSKGVAQTNGLRAEGNVASKGYPAWAISKGVARQNMENFRNKADGKEYPSEGITKDENQISKK